MTPDLQLPGIGRVVLGFLFTVAIGVAAIVALKRVLPKLFQRKDPQGAIRVLDRADLTPSLHVQVVQIEGRRIVIAEGKSGIGLTVLPDPVNTSSSAAQ